ncbi:MAG: ArsR family transcriptional regulator [Candidatus Bathyarchaeota archaeon]|jgi:DNA-binding transcriptional ArsR family regulator|nr:ArsR family transcriptional regulator [Candidatus Bathyarchaeota archaeon]
MKIEDVFSSRPRIKILRLLCQLGELNVSEMARRLGTNHETTVKHLKILESEGILKQKVFGRIRLYKINESSAKARAIQRLVETWETQQ